MQHHNYLQQHDINVHDEFSEWKPGKVIAYGRAMQGEKTKQAWLGKGGVAYQKKAWSIIDRLI